ncbi:hypothetical protein GGR51DRAFT_546095 [Nemania sp. FL0031]|nr:hypothetical protein GGR51DRAFT_546095 [Nemania sp. FL0031]
MCYQVVEIYSVCKCLYYQHAIDRCPSFDRQDHGVLKRTIEVGYACSTHSQIERPILSSAQNSAVRVPKHPKKALSEIAGQVKEVARTQAKNTNSDNTKPAFSSPILSSVPRGLFQSAQGTLSDGDEPPVDYTEIWKAKQALAEQSDSDDSVDNQSILSFTSQASTATTVDENALEAFKARQVIDRFLRRFAEDLECLATKSSEAEDEISHRIVLSSSRFVRRHRAEIASRICQAHKPRKRSLDADSATEDAGIPALDDAPDNDGDPFTFSIAEEFIFGTDPILYLEANVGAFIRGRKQKRFSPLAINLRLFTTLAVQLFCSTSIPTGKRRVGWTCVCGCRVIDDYGDIYDGATEAFERRLKHRNNVAKQNSWRGAIPTTIQWFRESLTKVKPQGLPSHRQDSNGHSVRLGQCARSAGTAQANHNFVLLCVPYLRWGLRLHNSEVCKINSDQEFFKLLRKCYFSQRHGDTRKPLRMLTKVQALRFVKFEVFRNKLVDIRVSPSMPTRSNDYTYDPMPPDVIPPIGPNLLMHLFENPDHADVTLFLYRRFPKKLRAQLEACSMKGSSIGWGIEFVEGVDWYAVFVLGCLGFLFCLVFAVAWSAAKGDVQGGFGIASFLLAFFVFCGGILHYMI